jgi:predicted kinase
MTADDVRRYVKEGLLPKSVLQFLDEPVKEFAMDREKAQKVLANLQEHAAHDDKSHGNWARGISHEPGEIKGKKKAADPKSKSKGSISEEEFNKAPRPFGKGRFKAIAKKEDVAIADSILAKLSDEEKQQILDIEKRIAEGTETIAIHRDKDGNWTPERATLHDEIIDTIFEGTTPVEGAPQLVVTGGLPGAGKSTVLKARGEEFTNHVHIDPDRIKGMLPEYEGWNATLVHEESSLIAERIMQRGIEGNYNIIYDASLKTQSSAHDLINEFEDDIGMNYNSKIVFVDVPMKMAMERAMNRFFDKGDGSGNT